MHSCSSFRRLQFSWGVGEWVASLLRIKVIIIHNMKTSRVTACNSNSMLLSNKWLTLLTSLVGFQRHIPTVPTSVRLSRVKKMLQWCAMPTNNTIPRIVETWSALSYKVNTAFPWVVTSQDKQALITNFLLHRRDHSFLLSISFMRQMQAMALENVFIFHISKRSITRFLREHGL